MPTDCASRSCQWMAWKIEPDARALDPVEDQQRQRRHDEHEIIVVDRRIGIEGDEAEIDLGQAGDALDAGRAAERDR